MIFYLKTSWAEVVVAFVEALVELLEGDAGFGARFLSAKALDLHPNL